MSTWDWNTVMVYDSTGANVGADDARTGTLTDNAAGDFFDTTETISGGFDPLNSAGNEGTFIGTIDVLGVTWVAIEGGSGNTIFYATVPPGTTTGDVNTAFNALDGAPSDLSNLTLVNDTGFTTCFAAGTLIATPAGECPVETLEIGDLVTTADGRAVPVKWIGRQTLHKIFTPADRFAPVRVTADALGDGLPHTDLVLTAEHALILDGYAINAGALVNGTTIRIEPRDSLPERVTYYHVETEGHEVILANGAPAETFVDYVSRRAFDNHAEFVDLYGDERVIEEMPALRISSPRLVPPSIRARLDDPRAA